MFPGVRVKKDRVPRSSSDAVEARTLEELLLSEFMKEQRAIAKEMIETARLLLERADLKWRLYEEQMGRLRIQ